MKIEIHWKRSDIEHIAKHGERAEDVKAVIMAKFEYRKVKEVEIKDVDNLLNTPLNEIQVITGGLTVESKLSELVEEADLNTKIIIMGNEVEIPVGGLLYDKLKGKKIKVVMQE